jgi:hypothetical protein
MLSFLRRFRLAQDKQVFLVARVNKLLSLSLYHGRGVVARFTLSALGVFSLSSGRTRRSMFHVLFVSHAL